MRSRILVAYGSKYGSTAVLAGWIGDQLDHRGFDVDVRDAATVDDLDRYDAVVVGGGFYWANWHPASVMFLQRFRGQLRHRPTWVFSSGPVQRRFKSGSRDRVAHEAALVGAKEYVPFGGWLRPDAGRWLTKAKARHFPEDTRDETAVRAWADGIADELAGIGATPTRVAAPQVRTPRTVSPVAVPEPLVPGLAQTPPSLGGPGLLRTASIDDARVRMDESGQGTLLVYDEDRPVGVVTRGDLDRATDGAAAVGSILTKEIVVCDPRADVMTTLAKYRDEAWRSLRRRAPASEAPAVAPHRAGERTGS